MKNKDADKSSKDKKDPSLAMAEDKQEEELDMELEQSFPASDPPTPPTRREDGSKS